MRNILFFALFISTTAMGQVDLNLGLRAYYPFSGNANDVSGNNNNPVFNNAVLTADRSGNPNSAYHFNGTSSYMRIPNNPTLNMTNKMSVAAWVKPTGYYTGTCYQNIMVMKADVNNLPTNYFLNFGDIYTGCTAPTTATERFSGNSVVAPAPIVQLNQWYSVVWTTDGINERLYVNCELQATAPASGIAHTNVYDLFFGHQDNATFPYWLNGDLDEVRIYDRPLNADEVKAYGDCIESVINTYTPVLALNPCENKITVEDGVTFNTGDTVLMIQMKGAVIDSTNTAAFGTITDYKNAGNYEINYVKDRAGNIIELKNKLTRQYDIPVGKVQLVRVPYYQNATITSTLTCLPWDGSKGGILVLNALDSVVLHADINVTGKGFKGGIDPLSTQSSYNCYENQYFYPPNLDLSSQKGEGAAIISTAKSYGKGALANGGGSGNSHNSGGGGGANAGKGGHGGFNYEGPPCNTTIPFDNGGIGGNALTYNNVSNKIFLGGGGGAGQTNTGDFQANGGNGAGIIIIIADKLKSNGNKIIANGNDAPNCGNTGPGCREGMGGGGAGGTVLSQINNFIDNTTVEIKGGKGGDMTAVNLAKMGPGGGGGGGLTWLSKASLPANVSSASTGGPNGVCTDHANNPWGATAGLGGSNLFNLQIPVDNILFKKNIDSVRLQKIQIGCDTFDFKGLGYTNTSAVTGWYWDFGDGGTAITQDAGHLFGNGDYTVKLIATDINGCKDSILTSVTIITVTLNVGADAQFCAPVSLTLPATSTGASQYQWTPAGPLSDPAILNPVATLAVTTMFYLTATHANGCFKKDSILIAINSPSSATIDHTICEGQSYNGHTTAGLYTDHFTNSGGCDSTLTLDLTVKPKSFHTVTTTICEGQSFEGYTTSGTYLNTFIAANGCDSVRTLDLIVTPARRTSIDAAICEGQSYFAGGANQTLAGVYADILVAASGCDSIVTTTLRVNLKPQPDLGADKNICPGGMPPVLDPGVFDNYEWNNLTALPTLTVTNTGQYWVTVTDANNCKNTDTIRVNFNAAPSIKARKTNDIDCAVAQTMLSASGGARYTWTPAATLNSGTSQSPIARPLVTTKYYLTGIDAHGCVNYDSVTVNVTRLNKTGYEVPTAFTPNNDGLNDCYGIKYWGNIFELEFSVYNRWGQRIFYTTDPNGCWDGRVNGVTQDPDIFVYMIKAKTSCEPVVFRKGTFALIR